MVVDWWWWWPSIGDPRPSILFLCLGTHLNCLTCDTVARTSRQESEAVRQQQAAAVAAALQGHGLRGSGTRKKRAPLTQIKKGPVTVAVLRKAVAGENVLGRVEDFLMRFGEAC